MGTLGKTSKRHLRYPAREEVSLEEQILTLESKTISVDEAGLDPKGNGLGSGKTAVILKAMINDDQVFQAIKNGAVMLLTRGNILNAQSNGRTATNPASPNSFNGSENDEEEMPIEPLSPRETEILSYVAYGNSNKQIAVRLHISQQTVKNHMTSILDKLYANDRTHAVVTALRQGWLTI